MTKEESEYSEKIDCRLNYSNTEEMVLLFETAKLISFQSVYRFLEELGHPPHKRLGRFKNQNDNIEYVLIYVDDNFNHSLKDIAFTAITAKLKSKYLPIKKAMKLMNRIRKNTGYYSLLNIINYSSKRNRHIGMVENLYDSIIQQWNEVK